MGQNGQKFFTSTRIALIATFSTLAALLYVFDFKLPIFPSFLSFKLADVPILISSFALGPVSATIVVAVQILIKLVVKGTTTIFIGELSDLFTFCAFSITAGAIYKKMRTFKGALIGIAIGTLCEVAVAILTNWLILVPFYVNIALPKGWDTLIGIMSKLFPECTKENFYGYYLWCSILPFNLLRCAVAALITIPVYKRISILINRFNEKLQPKQGQEERAKRVNIVALACSIGVAAILITLALLRYFVF